MKNKKQKKSGFTLVELMVVAIIVAILAAVAIPLMTGNKERAAATEGQAGCSTIATAFRMLRAQTGSYTHSGTIQDLPGIRTGDLNGTYFDDSSYAYTASPSNFSVTATAKATNPDNISGAVTMTVGADGAAVWSGTLLN